MGAEELGRYVFAWSWLIVLAVIPVSGHIAAAMRYIGEGLADKNPGYVRGFIRHAIILTLVGTVAIALAGSAVVVFSDRFSGSSQSLYLAALFGVPAMAQIKLQGGFANAFSRMPLSFLPNNVVRPTLFLASLIVAWFWYGELSGELAMWIHFAAMVAVAIPLLVYSHVSTQKHLGEVQPVYAVSEWSRTAISLLLVGLFTNNFPELMVITTGFFVPSAELGIFNVALRFALLVKFGLFAIDAFTAPALTQHYRKMERKELVRVVRHATKLRVLSTFIPFMIFLFAGQPVLGIFGPEFKSGYSVLIILGASYLPVAAVGPATRMLGVTGFHNQGLKASIYALVIWCVIAPILASNYGTVGAATAALITLTAWSAALWFYVRRCLSINTLSFLLPKRA
jgi:O-antigen/teichoic acid export membrane protein